MPRHFWILLCTLIVCLVVYLPVMSSPVAAQNATLPAVQTTDIDPDSVPCAETDGADLFGLAPEMPPPVRQEETINWTPADSQAGLAFAQLPVPSVPDSQQYITVIRIDPSLYDFSLHTISGEGAPAKTLAEWADIHALNVAINASMYLPDAKTSTGYMRNGAHINNPRIVNKFGAFFVASPKVSGLPPAAILDRTVDDWESLLPQYDIVVQNYRLINAQRTILWPEGGPMYSIAAVAQDIDKNILFIHSKPITAREFTSALLELPLNITRIMYVEGGPQAALLLNTESTRSVWIGHYAGDYFFSSPQAPLPNILGARKR